MWHPSPNSLPALLGNLAESGWHREEGCNLSTQHNDTLLCPSTNFGTWWHPWCPHPWWLAGWSSFGLQIPYKAVSHGMNASNLQICQTVKTPMRQWTLNSNHSQTQHPKRVWEIRQGQSTAVAIFDLSHNLFVVSDLAPDVLVEGKVWELHIIQPLLGCFLVLQTNLGYENWMVLKQMVLNKDGQALLVWCVLQWWLGWSATNHHPGLLAWHWVGLVCWPKWWCLTM